MPARAVACRNTTTVAWPDMAAPWCLPQVTEDFLARLRAPDSTGPEDASLLRPWWLRDLPLALLGGLLLGGVVFAALPAREPERRPVAPVATAPMDTPPGPVRPVQDTEAAAAGVGANPIDLPGEEQRVRRRLQLLARRSGGIDTYRGPYRRLLRKGWQRLGTGNFRVAAVAFGRAVHLYPDRAAAYYGLALSLFEQGREGAALAVLEQAQKRLGPKSDIWLLAGSAYQFLGREQMARRMYRLYLEKNPRGAYAHDVRLILSYDKLPRLPSD